MANQAKETVCVVGLWHLGIVNTVGFAEKGYQVVGLEFDPEKLKKLQAGIPPLFEAGVEELLKKYLGNGQLTFSDNPAVTANADYIVIAYDSPVNEQDEVSVTPVVEAANRLAPHLRVNSPLIITSQLPLGTSEKIELEVKQKNPAWESGVVYSPENLRLGVAVARFLKPDMVVLGAENPAALVSAQHLYQPFETKIVPMGLKSAEMVKHALNAFLATAITFGNEMANLADRLGADAVAVAQALKLDPRVGKAPILPGLGFSGGTLARDIKQLRKFSQELGYEARLVEAVIAINDDTFEQIVIKLEKALGSLAGKQIGILGLTYKPGTSTMRRSPAIKIIQKLIQRQATCFGYDPLASDQEFAQYGDLVTRVKDVETLAERSDALVLVTEWPEFLEVDYKTIAGKMKKPILIDTKNFLNPEQLTAAGFDWEGYGRQGKK